MTEFEVLSSSLAYEGAITRVRVDEVRTPDGDTISREVVEQDDAVAIVAITEQREVVLLRQYRHPFAAHLLELPAGKLDEAGESREQAIRRELAEEAGLETADLVELLTFDNSAGWTDERTTIYLGRGLQPVDAPDGYTAEAEEAHMDVVRLPLAEAVEMARRGEITDAKTVIGLLLVAGDRGLSLSYA